MHMKHKADLTKRIKILKHVKPALNQFYKSLACEGSQTCDDQKFK